MDNIFTIVVCGGFMCTGLHSLVRAFFPPTPKEDPDYNRWDVTTSTPWESERVVAEGMMSPSTAKYVSIIVGGLTFLGGLLYLFYSLGLLPFGRSTNAW